MISSFSRLVTSHTFLLNETANRPGDVAIPVFSAVTTGNPNFPMIIRKPSGALGRLKWNGLAAFAVVIILSRQKGLSGKNPAHNNITTSETALIP
jgi:hypothetical protein